MERRKGPCGEWLERSGGCVSVGYSKEALEPIGEVLWIGLPTVGDVLKKGETSVVFESAKAATDCDSPLSGRVVEVNSLLQKTPAIINESPDETWVYKIENVVEEEWFVLEQF